MTVQLEIPKELEQRLLGEVKAGRYASLQDAILEKLRRSEEVDLPAVAGMDAESLRRDLDEAWNDRDAVDGETVFQRIAAKSDALKAQGK